MGCMLRSDKMTFCEMYLQPEAAFDVLSSLGELGCVQFTDVTPTLPAMQRYYATDLCRCLEMERILNSFAEEIVKNKLGIDRPLVDPPAFESDQLSELEGNLENWEESLKEMNKYQEMLQKNQVDLQEFLYLLENVDPILGQASIRRDRLLRGFGEPFLGGQLEVRTGVVKRSKAYALETMLWRISKGNILFRPAVQDEVFEEPKTGIMIREVAFLAICQGTHLSTVLDKVCSAFHAHMFECPATYAERQDMIRGLTMQIDDVTEVIKKTKYHRCMQLRSIEKKLTAWLVSIKKTKSIFYIMNLFSMDITRKCLIGQCWIPTIDLKKVQDILIQAGEKKSSKVSSFISVVDVPAKPPTFHRTNKFTYGFQSLISAYGDALYGELNPGLYTIITFPFLFAIMFGDFGHGFIMLAFALWMVIKEKKFMATRSTNEIWNIFFGGRYVMLLMSIFTLYTGFIYNDCFSRQLHLKSSYWMNTYTEEILSSSDSLQLDPAGKTGDWYLLGIDPAWAFAKNSIMHDNSLKMKLSLIIGIMHMMFGLWLSLFNHIHFKKHYRIILEFIPQLMVLTCFFVYLVFMIIFKWIVFSAKKPDIKLQPTCAPSILLIFIDMCLMRSTEGTEPCSPYLFENQKLIQSILAYIAVINIPILLFGTPIYLCITNVKNREHAEAKLYQHLDNKKEETTLSDEDYVEQHLLSEIEHYSEGFGDLMIHQGLHTIEYVLSTISHTASYLRLWALSLAHAQLSHMLWDMILSNLALTDHSYTGILKIFVIWTVWAVLTICILVVMEGMSAFLHTLRLHWVEFMSKFFIGGGTVFQPFSFEESVYGERKAEKAMESGCGKTGDTKRSNNNS